MTVRLYLILMLLILAGCQTQRLSLKPPLEDQGELYLYTSPFPAEAGRLSFTIEGIAAVRNDGVEIPLKPELQQIENGAGMNRQRFLAGGQLPPGEYRGLALRVARPRLQRPEGPAALLTPDGAVVLDFPFSVLRQRALLLSLKFDFEKSVGKGVSFTPAFTISQPSRPVPGVIGYVTSHGANAITVIDKQAKEVVGVIATGRGPVGAIMDRDRRRAYVTLSGEDAVSVFDITNGEELRRIRLNGGDDPLESALTPDGRLLLTVNRGSNTVSFIDPLSFYEITRISVQDGPSSLVMEPTGLRAYVFNSLASTMSVIDIGRKSVVATVASESGVSRGAFNRGGDRLYRIHEESSYLTVLTPLTLALQQRFYVGLGAISLKVDPLTDLVFLGKKHESRLQVLEPFSFNPIAGVPMGGSADYMAIDAEENRLYALNSGINRLVVINLVNFKVEAELDVGADPRQVALIAER